MSESAEITLKRDIDKFQQQTGRCPYKIIMGSYYYKCLLEDLNNTRRIFGNEGLDKITEYAGIIIELDEEIEPTDLIIIEPEFH